MPPVSTDDQRDGVFRMPVHHMHDPSKPLVVHRHTRPRIRRPGRSRRVQQNRVRLETGARFAHRLSRPCDRRCPSRPVGAALFLRLQSVVPQRHAPRGVLKTVFVRAKRPQVTLRTIYEQSARRPTVPRIVPLKNHPRPVGFGPRRSLPRIVRPRPRRMIGG